MSWKKSNTTKHSDTCNMAFGRKDATCPRCIELIAGANPVQWAPSRAQIDAQRCAEIRRHDCRANRCGVVCTFGDW